MENYLRRCLDSLIIDEEGMRQLEVLVVNDGSKDSSSKIAHEYQNKYPETFKVIDKDNGNYGSCINRGLKEATGKYVKILDADDWFINTNFGLYIKYLSQIDVDMVLSSGIIINEYGNTIGGLGIPFRWSFKKYSVETLNMKQRTSIQMHCVAYKTDMIRQIEYIQLEGISYTDQLWVTYPIAAVKSYAVFNRDLYMYLVGRDGQTMNVSVQNKKFNDEILVSYRIIDWIEEHPKSLISYEYIKQKMVSRIEYLYSNHCIYGMYNENEFRLFTYNLKNKVPALLKRAEYNCAEKNQYNYIHDYNEGILDPKKCVLANKETNGVVVHLKIILKNILIYINDLYFIYSI